MSIFHKMFMAASGAGVVAPTPELADPYFDNVEVLLHGDGTNGSTTFTDSSPNPKTVTASGNAQIDTAIKKFGSGSAEFDGTNSKLTISGNPIGSGDFTIEFWVYSESISGNQYFLDIKGTNRLSIVRGDGSTSAPNEGLGIFDTAWRGTNSTLPDATYQNNWNHIAISRTSGTMKAFVNGTSVDSWTNSLDYSNETVEVGSAHTNQSFTNFNFDGYIDDLRITNGVGRYTSDFNPPTVAHPDIGSDQYFYATELLLPGNGTSGSTTITDSSSNSTSVTVVGNAQIDTAVKKFGTGSIQFDGDGDELTYTAPALSGDFTFEAFVYPESQVESFPQVFAPVSDATVGNRVILSYDTSTYVDKFSCRVGSNHIVASSTSSTGQFYHIAVVRSGSTIKMYIDGVSQGSQTFSTSVSSRTAYIGGNSGIGSETYFKGYIDDFRLTNGVARYTNNFTPPRIEHPDFGATREAVPVTANGTAQISTAQSKFGGSSGLFDGDSDYLSIDGTSYSIDLSGDFTIEFFVRHANATGNQKYLDLRESGAGALTNYILIDTSTNFRLFIDGSDLLSGGAGGPSADTWYHIAVVRNGTSIKYFLDGTEELDYTQSTPKDYTLDYSWLIGINGDLRNRDYLNGYLDELRFSSTARYTSNFTAPTSAFDNDSNTLLLLHMDGPNSSTTFLDDNGLLTSTE